MRVILKVTVALPFRTHIHFYFRPLSFSQFKVAMTELIRDTVFGHFLRLVTGGKVLPYEEDRDSSVWQRYVDKEKSARMADHGHTGEEEKEEGQERNNGQLRVDREPERDPTSENSSNTRAGSGDVQRNDVSGVIVDPEKGKDVNVVTWFGDNDPEVSQVP